MLGPRVSETMPLSELVAEPRHQPVWGDVEGMLAVASVSCHSKAASGWGPERWPPALGRPRGERGAVGSCRGCSWEPRALGI